MVEETVDTRENALQDEEVSKLRRLIASYRKKFIVSVSTLLPPLLFCWLIGYFRFTAGWLLPLAIPILILMRHRLEELVDIGSYLNYRWYKKRRAMNIAETSEWLNVVLKEWFKFSEAELSDVLKNKLDSKLQRLAKKTKVMQSMSLRSVSFGKRPPYCVAMRALVPSPVRKKSPPVQVDGNTVATSPSSGNSDSSAQLVIEADVEIRSEDFELHIDALIKSFHKPVDLLVKSLTLTGRLQLFVTFSRDVSFPHVARVQAAFVECPKVQFRMRLNGMKVNLMNVPLLRGAISAILNDTISKILVDPGRLSLMNKLRKLEQLRALPPRVSAVGVLTVTVDLKGANGPYTCVLTLARQRAKFSCTRTEETGDVSTDDGDDEETRKNLAMEHGELLYDAAPVRRAGPTRLCTQLLVSDLNSDLLRVRLKSSKSNTLAEWRLRLRDHIVATRPLGFVELNKETRRAGNVRVTVELSYGLLTSLNEPALRVDTLADKISTPSTAADCIDAKMNAAVADTDTINADVQKGVRSGALFVMLHNANNLMGLDRAGTSDPYCVISFNSRRVRVTTFHAGTCAPQFNFAFELLVENLHTATLGFHLFDYNDDGCSSKARKRSNRDDYLGSCVIDFNCASATFEAIVVRRVLPLTISANRENEAERDMEPAKQDDDDDDEDVLELPLLSRRTMPPSIHRAGSIGNLSVSSKRSSGTPKLGTVTVSYVFRPAASSITFYELPRLHKMSRLSGLFMNHFSQSSDASYDKLSDKATARKRRDPLTLRPPQPIVAASLSTPSHGRKHRHANNDSSRPRYDKMDISQILQRGHGLMEVCIVQLTELVLERDRSYELYCVLTIGNETLFKTRTLRTSIPIWNETITTRLPRDSETLELTVYDKGKIFRDPIGRVRFTREAVHDASKCTNAWYPLDGANRGKVSLAFRVIYDPQKEDGSDDEDDTMTVVGEIPPSTSAAVKASFTTPRINIVLADDEETQQPARSNDQRKVSISAISINSSVNSQVLTSPTPLRRNSHPSQIGSDNPSPIDSESVSCTESAVLQQVPNPLGSIAYTRVQGSLLGIRGLNYQHFLSAKYNDLTSNRNERKSATERDRLLHALQSAIIVLKLELENQKPIEASGGLLGFPSLMRTNDLIKITRMELKFLQFCNELSLALITPTEEREVSLSVNFDLAKQSAGKRTVYQPTASLIVSLKRKGHLIACKSYQLSQLLNSSGQLEPTWLTFGDRDQFAVMVCLTGICLEHAETLQNHDNSFRLHRGTTKTIQNMFSSNK